jgi:hypothetical protein
MFPGTINSLQCALSHQHWSDPKRPKGESITLRNESPELLPKIHLSTPVGMIFRL